jgi:hypothetical protein
MAEPTAFADLELEAFSSHPASHPAGAKNDPMIQPVFISPKTIGSWISWENMPKRSEEPRFGRKTRCRNVENHVFYSDFLVDVPLDQSNEST